MTEVSGYLESDFPRYCLENTYFYNLTHLKDSGLADIQDVTIAISSVGLKIVRPLQFQEANTLGFSQPRVFMCRSDQEGLVKARVCTSSEEAARIERSIGFARAIGISTPNAIRRSERFLVLDYTTGEHKPELSPSELIAVAQLHNTLNFRIPGIEVQLHSEIIRLLDDCYELIGTQVYQGQAAYAREMVQEVFPDSLIPVFDHQDLGKHNLIWPPDGQPVVIDEEAFGITPFGYSLYRAVQGRKGYNVCINDIDRQVYLEQFPAERVDYFHATMRFWELLLKTRSTARALIVGNRPLALSILETITN